MTANEFENWLDRLWLSDGEAARLLGVSRKRIKHFRQSGAPIYIGLACAAVAYKLHPWAKRASSPIIGISGTMA